ncbi:MAG: serine hydrolase [Myxococcota bacterium]
MHVGWSALALTLVASAAHAAPRGFDGPDSDDGGFQSVAPTPEALARYQAAARYSKAHGGRALLVVEGDAVVFEAAQNGYDNHHGHALWSGTKSFACALALAAQADGKLSLDERAAAALPALAENPNADAITVRDLLAFTSGLDDDGDALTIDFSRARPRVADKYRWVVDHIATLARKPPGVGFTYVPSHLALFGALMRAKLGRDPVDYLQEKVLDPIGFHATGWQRDPAGNPAFAFGVYTTPRAWARFGVLVRDDGLFRGRRVLPAGAFGQCFRGSAAMPAYGLTWWLNEPIPAELRRLVPGALGGLARQGRAFLPDGPADLVVAAGWKDNRLYVIPSRRLVVVRFGEGDDGFADPALLGALLGGAAH